MASRYSEAAFDTVIESHLLAHGCALTKLDGFDRERAIFLEPVLAFIRETQPRNGRGSKSCTTRKPASKFSPTCIWMRTARLRRGSQGIDEEARSGG